MKQQIDAMGNGHSALLGASGRLYGPCLRIAPLWGKTVVLGKEQMLKKANDGWMDG